MGRGHSGSTILDILLGGGAAVESVGELVSGLEWYEAGTPCACGAPMRECPYWAEIRRRVEAEGHDWAGLVRASRRHTDVRRWLPTRLARRGDPELCRLAAITPALARAIAATDGTPHRPDSN